jgi:hypothetical protein
MAFSTLSRQDTSVSDVAVVSRRSPEAQDHGLQRRWKSARRRPCLADHADDGPHADRSAWLAGLIDPAPAERVVDLGCGESSVLELVLPRVEGGVAVGIDNDVGSLQAAQGVGSGFGEVVAVRSGGPGRPAAPGRCVDGRRPSHDVLEQLPDPDAVLGVVLAGADVRLTRRLVHAYCDTHHGQSSPAGVPTSRRRLAAAPSG